MEHSLGWVQIYIYNLFIFYEQEYFVIALGTRTSTLLGASQNQLNAYIKQKETEPAPALIPHPLTS